MPRAKDYGADIGRRLRVARAAAGLTMAELAERAGTTSSTIVTISNSGKGGASSVNLIARLARACGVQPSWLAYGIGDGPEG